MVLRVIKLLGYVCSRRSSRSIHSSAPVARPFTALPVRTLLCPFAYSMRCFLPFILIRSLVSLRARLHASKDRRRVVFMHSKYIKCYILRCIPVPRRHCSLSLPFFNFCNATQQPIIIMREAVIVARF